MRKLMMKMSVSLDGFVCNLDGASNWIFKSSDEASRTWSLEKSWESGLIIMGRKSFEMMANYWPTATSPFAAPMNEIPKAVFTQKGFDPRNASQGTETSWSQAQVCAGDLTEEIMQLKSQPGKPITAIGGAGFMRSLIAADLIDEYHLLIHPVILGTGMPIFSGVTEERDLKLVATKVFPGGIVAHTYQE